MSGFGVGATVWKNNGGNRHTEDQIDTGLKRPADSYFARIRRSETVKSFNQGLAGRLLLLQSAALHPAASRNPE
jgi:hypothetical protein